MPRITIVIDVDAVIWERPLSEGEEKGLARAALLGACSHLRATGTLWDHALTVAPVRFELDGEPTLCDPPF